MKVSKAIEILTTYMKGSDEAEPIDFDDAIKLGTEALKRIQKNRIWPEIYHGGSLPGETPEDEK